ncbi:MAG TPA: ABC transporter ATP-binding protein [Candidatus Syntrophoarchaeum butanivorans]|uniref:ABC transporter ATP-binding protein n=2 Tax=Candidatus Syntropharchaeum butanivorans TaxID=1839936 RepID=A0A1F2P4W1_9EURY|nr:MAG: methyl coenzyme M reductase system, component A2 [Candidatus Syntrophoarchaeum butanivorans]HEC56746.1 ABC transporter ATP-binding protein [Candidatus Syntrophoarchaeum butanivorans]
MSILEVHNLKKIYHLADGGMTLALDGVSFELEEKEILGIIGKSGSGKTTLMMILRGVLPFDEGRIVIGGVEYTPDADMETIRAVKDMTAIHLQRSFAFWSDTTIENVMRRVYALKTHDETILPPEDTMEYEELREKAMKYLEMVGLTHKAEQAAHTLSGGEKQRLLLARQLAIEPKILLLDEPLTMASPEKKREAIETIKRLREKYGISILLVSHMPKLHESLADRLLWIDSGRIIKEGDVKEITSEFMSGLEPVAPLPPLKERKPIFKLNNVTKRYYHYTLSKIFEISNIDLTIYKGEILGIIGPSGVGKTVLMRVLAGIELPNEGSVLFYTKDGGVADLTKLGFASAMIRQKIGILHQEFGLTHHATVEEIIKGRRKFKEMTEEEMRRIAEKLDIRESLLDFVLRLADMPAASRKGMLDELEIDEEELLDIYAEIPQVQLDKKEVMETFRLLGLPKDILKRRSYELSGGEKIRVALAVELASKPELLILDEPFGDLDPLTSRKVSNLLKEINAKLGTSLCVVSHDRELLADTTHRIILIKDGVIKREFSPEELVNL